MQNFFSGGTSAKIFYKLVFVEECANYASGGMGHMKSTKSERLYCKVKVMMIGGGAEEIMKELAAKQLGI